MGYARLRVGRRWLGRIRCLALRTRSILGRLRNGILELIFQLVNLRGSLGAGGRRRHAFGGCCDNVSGDFGRRLLVSFLESHVITDVHIHAH